MLDYFFEFAKELWLALLVLVVQGLVKHEVWPRTKDYLASFRKRTAAVRSSSLGESYLFNVAVATDARAIVALAEQRTTRMIFHAAMMIVATVMAVFIVLVPEKPPESRYFFYLMVCSYLLALLSVAIPYFRQPPWRQAILTPERYRKDTRRRLRRLLAAEGRNQDGIAEVLAALPVVDRPSATPAPAANGDFDLDQKL